VADDLKRGGGQDRTRIDVHEAYELRDWANKFGVHEDEIRRAVPTVGDGADKVAEYLVRRGIAER
jgi:hypothetical protein